MSGTFSDGGHVWKVETLWEAAEGLPVQRRSVKDLLADERVSDLALDEGSTLQQLAKHVERIRDADLRYPVILTPEGELADGAHRILKALLKGEGTEVPIICLMEMPPGEVR